MTSKKLMIALLILTLCTIFALPAIAHGPGMYTVVNDSFTVGAGQSRRWNFHVESNGVRVRGRFRAEGGSGNDIIVLILNADEYENYQNGHTVSTRYNSGKQRVGSIDINLKEGDYFLVFDNSFSTVSNKAVKAAVIISWE